MTRLRQRVVHKEEYPYVQRDPRWGNGEFFARWYQVRAALDTAPEGAARNALLEELDAIQDHFFNRAY